MTEPQIMLAPEEFAPMREFILLDDDGNAWVPDAYALGSKAVPMRHGLALAWAPFLEAGGSVLILWSGNPKEPGEEAIVTSISREGLQGLIADLQSIDRQLGAMT